MQNKIANVLKETNEYCLYNLHIIFEVGGGGVEELLCCVEGMRIAVRCFGIPIEKMEIPVDERTVFVEKRTVLVEEIALEGFGMVAFEGCEVATKQDTETTEYVVVGECIGCDVNKVVIPAFDGN